MNTPGAGAAFLAARDFILKHRIDYDTAVRDFEWPSLDRFNWALDYFDIVAGGNDRPALHIVEEDGTETIRSFAELSAESNRVANFLRGLGARNGDCLMLMLGNEVALWETLLAAIKLGVVVTPATTLLTTADLQDRVDRGRVRHVVAGAGTVSKFDGVTGTFTRIAVGEPMPGWHPYEAARQADAAFTASEVTRASDPMLLYFTSGTTAKPKLVVHTHQSYPAGHLSTLYWIGLQPAIVTGTSAPQAGPSTPGAPSSRRGTRKRRSSSSITRVSTRRPCSTRSSGTGSPACAPRRPSGGC